MKTTQLDRPEGMGPFLDTLDEKIARATPWLYAAVLGAMAVLAWLITSLRDLLA